MKPIRVQGIYEIYGRDHDSGDGRRGDAAVWLTPDKLDTSLSLGKGKLGAADWEPGLRDAMIADKEGNRVPVCEAQIATYAERWSNKTDPPNPEILVLSEGDADGDYTGRYTFRVIDGAMWVAAAKKAGVGRVPVYVVHPTLPHVEPEAMWLYFNTVKNGLAPTSKQRERILKDLAHRAREARGITDQSKDAVTEWVAVCARATAAPDSLIREATKGIFATRRSDEQRAKDRADLASGKKTVGQISRATGKSRTAVRKDAKRHGVTLPKPSSNGHRPKPDAEEVVEKSVKEFSSALNGEAKDALQQIQKAAAALKPAVHELVGHIERLTGEPDLEGPSYAERVADCRKLWVEGVDHLWQELVRLARQLKLYSEPDLAKRDLKFLEEMLNLASVTLGRGHDPVAHMNGDRRGAHQMAVLK